MVIAYKNKLKLKRLNRLMKKIIKGYKLHYL